MPALLTASTWCATVRPLVGVVPLLSWLLAPCGSWAHPVLPTVLRLPLELDGSVYDLTFHTQARPDNRRRRSMGRGATASSAWPDDLRSDALACLCQDDLSSVARGFVTSMLLGNGSSEGAEGGGRGGMAVRGRSMTEL